MAENFLAAPEELLTGIKVTFDGVPDTLQDFTVQEVNLGESLFNPSTQTHFTIHNYAHNVPIKNLDDFKNSFVNVSLKRPLLKERFNLLDEFYSRDRVYRLDSRAPINRNIEEMTFRACHETLLVNQENLVSKSWKCTRPSDIVEEVLKGCAGADRLFIEKADPARDYVAENIHPFQVVAQQSNVALAEGNDPSFMHFMTYEDKGTHHFRSLKKMTQQTPVMTYYYSDSDNRYADPRSIMTYSFPCDFDLLSDLMNGVSRTGQNMSSLMVINPVNKMMSLLGDQNVGCGIGAGVFRMAQTNYNTAKDQNSCNTGVEQYLLLRQARMSLVEKDKIALRLTVPWNPMLNVGKVIELDLKNKEDPTLKNYGTGTYLILHLYHNAKRGGFATTTMDCVSTTVGKGIV